MGGLGPGIGGLEILVIGLLALIVVGPKDLPLMMRKVGQFLARARAMANEFRSSFDEMARQAELDELRKEVEALRNAQAVPLGAEAEEAFRDIDKSLKEPLALPPSVPAPLPEANAEVPEAPEVSAPEATAGSKPVRKPRAKATKSPSTKATAPARPKATRKKAVDL
ncbi:Sec-independent protein translocase protein TatB [Brevundimonas sp.]|uniref:Sec-independent protein translocase protein TatB n=1 Tax=Brevundimonas sp. TaxID=1871086 RepID=UPI001D3235EC|nr:Sec-independent protein translocase protein TatB [Brevundimonas sp.]MBL0947303.1 twin-arginine translocase subunit TatB [Brevundimonas sp.]